MTTRVIITAAIENSHALVVENIAGYVMAILGRGEQVRHLVVYGDHALTIREGQPLAAAAIVSPVELPYRTD